MFHSMCPTCLMSDVYMDGVLLSGLAWAQRAVIMIWDRAVQKAARPACARRSDCVVDDLMMFHESELNVEQTMWQSRTKSNAFF
jgi:hypothetical protein